MAIIDGNGKLREVTHLSTSDLDIWQFLQSPKITHAWIEKVHAMPGQGVTSMFSFGENFGKLQMALTASKTPFERVLPTKWQKQLPLRKRKKDEVDSAWKRYLKSIAQELFPREKITLATADAILIAEALRRSYLK